MAYNVVFKKGTQSAYNSLATKDSNTIYVITDTPAVYLGSILLTSVSELTAALSRITANEGSITSILNGLNGIDLTTQGSVKSLIDGVETSLEGVVGDLDGLTTTDKTDVVSAINDLQSQVTAITAGAISIVEEQTPTTGYAKTYTFKAGNATIGTINIPKDMVVESGSVVDITYNSSTGKLMDGSTDVTAIIKGTSGTASSSDAGKYIKLVIANATDSVLYIKADDLVDIYTAQSNATQVQLSINSGVVSATIVAGSIGTTELASDAVLTVKIKDKNVTTAKLADNAVTNGKLDSSLQSAISKANSSVQSVGQGTANGTISVDGIDVSVKGLGTAAYTSSSDYEVAGAASTVQSAVTGTSSSEAGSLNLNGLKKSITALETAVGSGGDIDTRIANAVDALDVSDSAVAGKYVSQVTETNGKISVTRANLPDYSNTYDAKGAANTAETNAKAYTDTALTWGSI